MAVLCLFADGICFFFFLRPPQERKLVVERGLDNGEEGVGMEDGEGA
jgi:hypothetical protein